MSVCVYMCIYVCVCMLLYIVDVCICLYTCMLASNCCVCIWQTSPLSSARLRMHAIDTRWRFLRWLTALHVNNNNIFITFKPLPIIFLYFSPTEDEDVNFFGNCLRVHLNEWMKDSHKLYLHCENSSVVRWGVFSDGRW